MARRGDVLHEHILDVAKQVFLELGYERTSMDVVAARAATSKRSLYAHFPTKEALFGACIERLHTLFEGRLSVPSQYADEPLEAVVRYCARFRQLLAYAPIVRISRMGITEADRLPEASRALYASYVGVALGALAAHLAERCTVPADDAPVLAERLVGATVFGFWSRALFGLEALRDDMPDAAALAEDVDLEAVRAVVGVELGRGSLT
ncbi:TetR/AcrR family transcriptional regulator [Microlunatus flavus]|uniref:DNA-binding transcriptional regulator, AcrR family n=1 Tax=Microlunatus flavus TaxID=1036181 RepID=A0A1H9C8Q4_9ACTN|nr:TetR/AcrR family transcriptional regulator [Microlunatus flavus]SEP97361.1 DNA-binding transcriptional regulator, AcrR family [Microlunatus flavus]